MLIIDDMMLLLDAPNPTLANDLSGLTWCTPSSVFELKICCRTLYPYSIEFTYELDVGAAVVEIFLQRCEVIAPDAREHARDHLLTHAPVCLELPERPRRSLARRWWRQNRRHPRRPCPSSSCWYHVEALVLICSGYSESVLSSTFAMYWFTPFASDKMAAMPIMPMLPARHRASVRSFFE